MMLHAKNYNDKLKFVKVMQKILLVSLSRYGAQRSRNCKTSSTWLRQTLWQLHALPTTRWLDRHVRGCKKNVQITYLLTTNIMQQSRQNPYAKITDEKGRCKPHM